MLATYTYNDAIDDAKGVVYQAIEETVKPYPEVLAEPYIKLLLMIAGRLEGMKRRSRAKRKKAT